MKKILILFMSFCLCACEDTATNIKAKCEYLGENIDRCDLGDVVCYRYFIVGLAVFMSLLAGVTCLMSHQAKQMNQYAIEHNCRWDYNDMCYTREQRPWLFK